VRRILRYPLGGFSEIEREPPTPGRELPVICQPTATTAGDHGMAQKPD